MSARRRRTGGSVGGRKKFTPGGKWLKVFRWGSLRWSRDRGLDAKLGSQGWTVWTPLGPITRNRSTDHWSWNTPRWGRIEWYGRFRDITKIFLGSK